MRKNQYVFVVCGAKEHIDTLNYSLTALKKFSSTNIIVVTDTSRNGEIIKHSDVIDVPTPKKLNHHQASIFLKTSLFEYLPAGQHYCYLDTDVVALDTKVDEIFSFYNSPITFAPDHCHLDQFSPSAINCGCLEQFDKWQKELKELIISQKKYERIPENLEKKSRLQEKFSQLEKHRDWSYIFRFWLSPYLFRLDDEFSLDKRKKIWVDRQGNPVIYQLPNVHPQIEDFTEYRQQSNAGAPVWTIHGKEVFDCRCGHLVQAIQRTFGITVADPSWNHWNGGVFLFDSDESSDFLQSWHNKTLQIFNDKEWKTRDQGTLIATVWEHGLQHHPTLPSSFNLIADYDHQQITHTGGLKFCVGGSGPEIRPHFIHVYHHWGDSGWDVWNEVEKKTGLELDAERDIFNALWIGNTLSKLELLTIASFIAHGHPFRLWTYDKIKTPLPAGVLLEDAAQIIPKENVFNYSKSNAFGHGKGSYAGFSDIFRYKLLYDRGGWWSDMDVSCLKPIYTDKPYFFRPHHELAIVGNVMRCPKGSELMRLCYEKAKAIVNADNTDWHKPIQILNEYVFQLGLNTYISGRISNQDRWEETSKYIWDNDSLPKEWMFIHWQNEEWRSRGVSKTDFYHRSALASLLDKYGLYKMPDKRKGEVLNEIRHHAVMRGVLKVLNWYDSPD